MGSIVRYNIARRAIAHAEEHMGKIQEKFLKAKFISNSEVEIDYYISSDAVLRLPDNTECILEHHFGWGPDDDEIDEFSIEEYSLEIAEGAEVIDVSFTYEREDTLYLSLSFSGGGVVDTPLFNIDEDEELGIGETSLSQDLGIPIASMHK